MEEKKCSKCSDSKPISKFSKKCDTKDGLSMVCKQCDNRRVSAYNKTKKGLVTKIYSAQRVSSKRRKYPMPTYTKQELMDWCFRQKLFHQLYGNWVYSGYKRDLIPSCDRTDDYKGYSLSRLQLMTGIENRRKSHMDVINGINTKQSKAIIATHEITGYKIEFYSIGGAARELSIGRTSISRCCRGKQKTIGGYKWRFE